MIQVGGNIVLSIFCLLIISNAEHCENPFERVCYYSSWSGLLNNMYSQPELCTVIIYAHAKLENGILIGSNPIIEFKKYNPNIKLMVSVGGWSLGIDDINLLLRSKSTRKQFIEDAVKYTRTNGYDGLDLDFKFPNVNITDLSQSHYTHEKYLFKLLCQEMRSYANNEIMADSEFKLLLSASIGCRKPDIQGYEINEIANYLDFLNLMTFDLRDSNDQKASHHSALFASLNEEGEQLIFNQDWIITHLLNLGIKSSKLMLGIAFFGKSFIFESDLKMLGAPAKYKESIIGFKQICYNLKKGWQRIFADDQKVPFIYKDNIIIGYDDLESIEAKLNYVIGRKLGGVSIWSLDFEDSNGVACSMGNYPLMNRIYQIFSNQSTSCTLLSSTLPTTSTYQSLTILKKDSRLKNKQISTRPHLRQFLKHNNCVIHSDKKIIFMNISFLFLIYPNFV